MLMFIRIFVKLFSKKIIKLLENNSVKSYIIGKFNSNIDIPEISEEQERQIFDKIYSVLLNEIKGKIG